MNLSRCVVSLLVLGIASPTVAAGRPQHSVADSFATEHVQRGLRQGAQIRFGAADDAYSVGSGDRFFRVTTSTGEIASVSATLSSASGDEELALVETDTRLHGAAAIATIPSDGAALSVTLYDARNASLLSFSGRLGADGTVALTTDAPTCTSRLGCGATTADIDLLSAEIVPADGGYALALDLGGADTADVAYADVTYTPPCASTQRTCTTTPVRAEVYWDALATVWEAPLGADHAGAVDARIRSYDARGHLVEDTRTSVGLPWDDGDDGVNVVPLEDGDAFTTMGFLYGREGTRIRSVRSLALVSDGWTSGEAMPTRAEVDLDGGGRISIPAGSYQRKAPPDFMVEDFRFKVGGARFVQLVVNGGTLTLDGAPLTPADLAGPLCAEGICVTIGSDATGTFLTVTQYRWDTAFPEDSAEVGLTLLDDAGEPVFTQDFVAVFDDEVSVVFSAEVALGADAVGTAFSGRLRLLDDGGGNDALAHGSFYSVLGVDGGGDLGVTGVGVDDVASANTTFAVLLGAAPSSCGNDDDGFLAVPPLAATFGNGSGTKNASSQASTKPQLL